MKITKIGCEVNMEITPGELAEIYWRNMDAIEQVKFWNRLAEIIPEENYKSDYNMMMQMQEVTDIKDLSKEARNIMKIVGEYSQKL